MKGTVVVAVPLEAKEQVMTIETLRRFRTLLVPLPALSLVLTTAAPALAAGGACPTGNQTIDPSGNPLPIANVGVTGTLPGAITGCFYVSKSTGLDTNTGTDAMHPWAHLPGMPSCTGTCASATPSAGEGFILRGGETWAPSDLGITWTWSGSSSHPIYVGVDQTWFSTSCGSSWCRPIFDAQGAVSSNMFYVGNDSWVIFDNIEAKGMTNAQNGFYEGGGSNIRATQNYFHGWSHTGNTNNVGFFSQCGPGSMSDHNVIDGSDSSKNTMNGVFGFCAGTIQYNYFNYVVSAILGSVDDVNDNLVENAVESIDGDHCNGIFTFGPQTGKTLYVYNNITRKMQCDGGVNFWLVGNSGGCTGCTTYGYNNIIDASKASGNVFNIGGHPSDGDTGTYYVNNNTIIANNGGTCMGNGESPPRSITNFANNHCIGGSASCDGTGTTCNDKGTNLVQALAQADANTSPHFDQYTSSETHEYSSVASTNSTVQAGTNLKSSCSGAEAALCSSIAYPVYNTSNHTMSASATSARPSSGAWDIGAYQYSPAPAPPANLTAVAQ